jgi:hypothetical protein
LTLQSHFNYDMSLKKTQVAWKSIWSLDLPLQTMLQQWPCKDQLMYFKIRLLPLTFPYLLPILSRVTSVSWAPGPWASSSHSFFSRFTTTLIWGHVNHMIFTTSSKWRDFRIMMFIEITWYSRHQGDQNLNITMGYRFAQLPLCTIYISVWRVWRQITTGRFYVVHTLSMSDFCIYPHSGIPQGRRRRENTIWKKSYLPPSKLAQCSAPGKGNKQNNYQSTCTQLVNNVPT